MATECTHGETRFPARPEPDAWYRCPVCHEHVSRRGGKIVTMAENNAAAAAQRARLSPANVAELEAQVATLTEERDGERGRFTAFMERADETYRETLARADAAEREAATLREALRAMLAPLEKHKVVLVHEMTRWERKQVDGWAGRSTEGEG